MGEITARELWGLLSDRERMVIRATKEGKYISGLDDVYDDLTAKDYIVPVKASQTLTPGKAFTLTEAGQELLPKAGEAELTTTEAEAHDAILVKLGELYKAYKANPRDTNVRLAYFEALADARLTDFYMVLDDKKSLQKELAAANERAEAAAREVARLREVNTALKTIYDICVRQDVFDNALIELRQTNTIEWVLLDEAMGSVIRLTDSTD